MIHSRCKYYGASRSLDDDLIVSFAVDEDIVQELESYKESDLVLEVCKYREKRSLNANNYFWKLCTEIATKLQSDKDSIYVWLIGKYGSYVDMQVSKDAMPALARQFRYTEVLDEEYLLQYLDTVTVRCYLGSSTYDTKEMSRLIDGAVSEARGIGISTWSDEEIDALVKAWKG